MGKNAFEKSIDLFLNKERDVKWSSDKIEWLKTCRKICLEIDLRKNEIKNYLPYLTKGTRQLIEDLHMLLEESGMWISSHWKWANDPYLAAFCRWTLHQREFVEFYPKPYATQRDYDGYWKLLLDRLLSILDSDIFKTDKESMQRLRRYHTKQLVENVRHFKCAYSKIMLIRVDLGFSKKSLLGKPWGGGDSTDMTRPLAKITEWMKTHSSSSYLHHEVKLEFGADKGLHAHCLFILNASKVREDETIGALIVEQWKNLTNGEGVGFNCNNPAYKSRMAQCGIGVFGDDDPDFLRNVKRMVSYLAKPDYLLRIAYPEVGRVVRSATIAKQHRLTQENRALFQQRMQILSQPSQ